MSWFFFLNFTLISMLIGQLAEIASEVPERLGSGTMGRRRRVDNMRTGRGRNSIARAFGRSRGAGTPRWTALFSTARRRRTRETRSSAA